VLRGGLISVALTALAVTAGVLVLSDEGEPTPPPEPAYESTPLARFDTSTVTVVRAPFCDRVPDQAVTEALGGGTGTLTSYENGQRAEVAPGVEDVAHEYGCLVVADDGAEARAWLFAPPVTRARAADLVALAAEQRRCARQPDAPSYGDPSVALVCRSGDFRSASFRGLFGDAWLSCSVTAPAGLAEAELLDRAGRFCVAVAEAARE
jgi:hypothetical protein